ncbi:hypothetical protein FQN54_009312 [Arachnomyces sp. PD_36]|nr:hypothetical protein FQN54_009312 [Arachnomyces sp. PD_36]
MTPVQPVMAKSKQFPELQFERKNKQLQKIPKNARVEKRPILHPPIASPYAGSSVPKVVYVSTKTPFMCAVKRVQKLLRHAEKRATSKVDLGSKKISEKAKLEQVVQAQEALKKEEVLVMATGRAIEKAMSIEKWFRERDEEYEVKVRTKAVLVVDDIVADENMEDQNKSDEHGGEEDASGKSEDNDKAQGDPDGKAAPPQEDKDTGESEANPAKSKSFRRKQRAKERKKLSGDDHFDSRTRYVNGVDIIVSLK